MNIFQRQLQRIKSVKRDFLAKSPLEKWLFYRRIHSGLLKIIGVEFMEEDYRINALTFIPIFMQVLYYILMIYSMYYYRNQPKIAILSTILIGFFIPGFTLLVIVLMPSTRARARFLYNFVGEYIFAKSPVSTRTYAIFDRMAIGIVKNTAKALLIFSFTFSITVIQSVLETFYWNERMLIVPVILPFIDPDSSKGFYINLVFQIIVGFPSIVVVIASEIVICVVRNVFITIAALTEDSISEFMTVMESNEKFSHHENMQFRSFIQKILEVYSISEEVKDLLYWRIFLHPACLMYSITLGIYSYLTGQWIAGLGLSSSCYVQLLVVCEMGKAVDNANDTILDALDRFPYYLLPPKQQEIFRLILCRVQIGTKLQMGPLAELNFETSTKFTKMIYSYVMMMLRATK